MLMKPASFELWGFSVSFLLLESFCFVDASSNKTDLQKSNILQQANQTKKRNETLKRHKCAQFAKLLAVPFLHKTQLKTIIVIIVIVIVIIASTKALLQQTLKRTPLFPRRNRRKETHIFEIQFQTFFFVCVFAFFFLPRAFFFRSCFLSTLLWRSL